MKLTDTNKEVPSLTKDNEKYWKEVYFKLKAYEEYTGKKVLNKNSGTTGIVLRITESGSIQVVEKIIPGAVAGTVGLVICTHDNWNTLDILD